MRKILIAAALLVCLAATALAGGTQEKETPEYFKKPSGESGTEYTYGENMPGVYTYGGSKRDWINGMAVAPDGRIAVTGYTESSDGTLSDRTKTWRAGWVMMLDKDMNVLWNFCSRSGDADCMYYPVFHQDGSVSVAHETEGKQIKIIRLDQDGEEVYSSTVMRKNSADEVFRVLGATTYGYVLEKAPSAAEKASSMLYEWNGNQIHSYGNGDEILTVGEKHFIVRNIKGVWLYELDQDGARRSVAKLSDLDDEGTADRSYQSVVTLEDGGAAACGRIVRESGGDGLISRWDAQGNLVFEMYVMGNTLSRLTRTADGFAALRIAQEEGKDDQWELVCFDENGILSKTKRLEGALSRDAGDIAVLDDGAIVCAHLTGLYDDEDVLVTVVETK